MQKIAAVQRQIHDALILDHRADRGVLRVEQRRAGRHLNGFGHRSDSELEVQARDLLDLQLDTAADRALERLPAIGPTLAV